MRSECLPFPHVPHSSRLFLDFLSYSGKSREFYPRSPLLREWVRDEAQQIEYPAERRKAVADVLEAQNRRWGMAAKTEENLRKFREGAAVVVTGQQVGLFGGPLFALLKALTAVKLAEQSTERGVPAVPVFWLATEDHDLQEVNYTTIPTDGSLAAIRTESRGVEDSPVGSIQFGEEINSAVTELVSALGPSEITDAVQEAYRPGETMGNAFGTLMARIFGEWGVILIDPLERELHRIAEPMFRIAVERAAEIDRILLERGQQLESSGYHQQVKVTSSSTLLFEIRDGRRTVVQRINDHFKAGEEQYSREQLLERIAKAPEAFSPNVLLRPIVQDYLLPTLAYTGGPAEVAYFAQVGVVYQELLGRVTPVLPRFSATLVEPKPGKYLEKYDLKLSDLFHGPEPLRDTVAKRIIPSSLQTSFDQTASAIASHMARIREDLEKLDSTLVDAAHGAEAKMLHQVEQLRGRAARSELRRNEIIENHVAILANHLYPNKDLQEREIAGVYFLAKHGLELLHTLHDAARNDCPDHQVVYL